MITGIIIGVAAAVAAIVYFEMRHAYFARKITAATATAQAVASDAKNVAQAAQATVATVKAAVDTAVKK
jgi:hypothetical protein